MDNMWSVPHKMPDSLPVKVFNESTITFSNVAVML